MMFKLLSLAGIVAVASAGSHVETIDCTDVALLTKCATGCSGCTAGQNDATCPDLGFCINSCLKLACCAEALTKQETTCQFDVAITLPVSPVVPVLPAATLGCKVDPMSVGYQTCSLECGADLAACVAKDPTPAGTVACAAEHGDKAGTCVCSCLERCDCDEDAKSMKVYKDAKAAMDAAAKAATDAAATAGVDCFGAGAQKCATDCAKCVPAGCGTTNIGSAECPIACAACATYISCAPDPAVPGSCPGTLTTPPSPSAKCEKECPAPTPDNKGETINCLSAEVTKCATDCSGCATGQNAETCPDIAFCAASCLKVACCATAQAATCQFVPEVKDEVTKGGLSECDQGKLMGLILSLPDQGTLCMALLGEALAEQTQKKDKSESEIAAIKPEDRKNAIAYECACYNSIPKEHPGMQPMTDANPDGDAMKCELPGSTTEIDGRVRQCWAGNHDTQHANCNCMKNGCARTPGDEPKDEECEEECDCDEDAKSMKVYKDAKAAMDAAGKAATDAAAKAGVACFEAGAQKCAKDCAKCVPLGCGTTNINTPECPIACAACGTYASCAPDPAVPGSCPGTAPVPHAVSEKCKEECKPKDTKKDTKPTKKPFNLDVELKKLLVGLDVTSEDADKFVEDMKPYMDALKKEVMPDGTTTPDLTKLFDNTVFTAAVTAAGVDPVAAEAAAASYEYDDGSDSAAAISAAAAAVAASIVAALF